MRLDGGGTFFNFDPDDLYSQIFQMGHRLLNFREITKMNVICGSVRAKGVDLPRSARQDNLLDTCENQSWE